MYYPKYMHIWCLSQIVINLTPDSTISYHSLGFQLCRGLNQVLLVLLGKILSACFRSKAVFNFQNVSKTILEMLSSNS